MQGAQKLRCEAHLQVRRNDKVEAQRRRWTFYETINHCFIRPVANSRKSLTTKSGSNGVSSKGS